MQERNGGLVGRPVRLAVPQVEKVGLHEEHGADLVAKSLECVGKVHKVGEEEGCG